MEAKKLKSDHAYEKKHVDELESRLEATEEALEEAKLSVKYIEERWVQEKSDMAHDADICQRLEKLNLSLTK
jgi:hypothetical protein